MQSKCREKCPNNYSGECMLYDITKNDFKMPDKCKYNRKNNVDRVESPTVAEVKSIDNKSDFEFFYY